MWADSFTVSQAHCLQMKPKETLVPVNEWLIIKLTATFVLSRLPVILSLVSLSQGVESCPWRLDRFVARMSQLFSFHKMLQLINNAPHCVQMLTAITMKQKAEKWSRLHFVRVQGVTENDWMLDPILIVAFPHILSDYLSSGSNIINTLLADRGSILSFSANHNPSCITDNPLTLPRIIEAGLDSSSCFLL